MSNNDDTIRKLLNGHPTTRDILGPRPDDAHLTNVGAQPVPVPMAQNPLAMVQQVCVTALEQARQILARALPGQQFLPAAIFVNANPAAEQNVVIAGMPIDRLHTAVVQEMKKAGVPVPEAPQGDISMRHALHNTALVAAIRRALPFITGPGAETARKLLVEATKPLEDEGPEQTVARVVAGLLTTLPGMTHREAADVSNTLINAVHGRSEVYLNEHIEGGIVN